MRNIFHKTPSLQRDNAVDLERYMGLWYEIASYPQWFEKGLTCVTALYTLKEDYVEVLNSGYKNGKLRQAHGRALVVKGTQGSRLKVSFFRPFYGQYWIVDLAQDYSWSVVSNQRGSTLWILSRFDTMDQRLYNFILSRCQLSGLDISKLVKMEHC
ncbi:MAG: lipocalin family protein [Mucinivorans sp.]